MHVKGIYTIIKYKRISMKFSRLHLSRKTAYV